MRCLYCEEQLIWEEDDQLDDAHGEEHIVTNLSCPNCDAVVIVSKQVDPRAVQF